MNDDDEFLESAGPVALQSAYDLLLLLREMDGCLWSLAFNCSSLPGWC